MKRTVLVIDDNRNNLMLETDILEFAGFTVLEAETAATGIACAIREKPDVIIMDYRMPGMNGIETAKRILENRPATRVIVASADDSIRDESISLGFSFLQKPFSLETFAKRIRRVVSQLPDNPSSTVAARSLPRRKRSSHRA